MPQLKHVDDIRRFLAVTTYYFSASTLTTLLHQLLQLCSSNPADTEYTLILRFIQSGVIPSSLQEAVLNELHYIHTGINIQDEETKPLQEQQGTSRTSTITGQQQPFILENFEIETEARPTRRTSGVCSVTMAIIWMDFKYTYSFELRLEPIPGAGSSTPASRTNNLAKTRDDLGSSQYICTFKDTMPQCRRKQHTVASRVHREKIPLTIIAGNTLLEILKHCWSQTDFCCVLLTAAQQNM
uniref:Uncharacterized protein n=1 Tax=Glossina pallidipes TaxID=7398 RepID=A0A1A9ZVB4_GLOPL